MSYSLVFTGNPDELCDQLEQIVLAGESTDVVLTSYGTGNSLTNAIACANIINTHSRALNITMRFTGLATHTDLVAASGLPPEQRKISPSTIVRFYKHAGIVVGTVTDMNIAVNAIEQGRDILRSLLVSGYTFTAEQFDEWLDKEAVMPASEMIPYGLTTWDTFEIKKIEDLPDDDDDDDDDEDEEDD